MTAPLIWADRIATGDDGLYRPNGNGRPALIAGIQDDDGELYDACAWLPRDPSRWWLRYGESVLLGWRELAEARFWHLPLVLHPSPLAWLAARGRGACILQWGVIDPRSLFDGIPRVICATPAVRRRLDADLRATQPLAPFRISTAGWQRHAA